jgi:hypothetical protein
MTLSINQVPLHKRSTRRLTITLPFHVFECLTQQSMHQGRSISNLTAFVLEMWANEQLNKKNENDKKNPHRY